MNEQERLIGQLTEAVKTLQQEVLQLRNEVRRWQLATMGLMVLVVGSVSGANLFGLIV